MLKLAVNCKMDFAWIVKSDITVVDAAVIQLCFADSQCACCIMKGHVTFKVTLHFIIHHNPITILPPSDTSQVFQILRTPQFYVVSFCSRHVYWCFTYAYQQDVMCTYYICTARVSVDTILWWPECVFSDLEPSPQSVHWGLLFKLRKTYIFGLVHVYQCRRS